MTAHLIKPLTEAQRVCLSCQVPGGCNENHPLCRWRIAPDSSRKPLSARNLAARVRQQLVFDFLRHGDAQSSELAARLGWSKSAVRESLVRLQKAGLVESVGGGRSVRWRLTDGN